MEEILKQNSIEQKRNIPQVQNIQTKDELVNALKGDFATGVTKIYVNSLGKEVAFKEITVQQQKTMSRIMIGNDQRKDIVYDAQCAIINTSALDDEFDIYQLTEFDRLKILLALYQANMFSNDVKFTCRNCGAENQYKLNFDNVLAKLDKIGLAPQIREYDSKKFNFVFTLAYPNVRKISNLYKNYYLQHKIGSKKDATMNDNMSNMEYINLFIQSVKLTIKSTGIVRNINMNDYRVSDIEEIVAQFPQEALYTENGVLTFIANEYIKKINESFDRHECIVCGAVHEQEGENRSESFL